MDLATKAARNSAYALVGFLYPTILTIVVTPIFIHYLGATRYGIYALSGVLFSFISLLDFGVAPTLLKFVSEYAARGELAKLNETVAASLLFYAAIGVVGLITSWTIAVFFVGDLFHLSGDLASTAEFVLLVSGVSFLISMLLSGLSSVPAGLQRFDLLTILGIAIQTPAAIANIVVLHLGFGLRGVTVVGAVAPAVGLIVFAMLNRRLLPGFRPVPRWNPELLRRVFSFSAWAFVANLAGTILFQLDKIFVGTLGSVRSVTFYAVPGNVAQRLHTAAASLSVVVLPMASDLMARGETERVKELYRRGARFVALFVCSVGIPLFVFAHEILRYWLGSTFAANSTGVLRLLVLTYAILALTAVPYYVVMAAGKPRIAAIYGLAAAALNIILIVALIPPFGIVGAAVAYLASTVAAVPFIWYTERRILGIERSDWLSVAAQLAVPSLAQAGACVVLMTLVTSLWTLLIALCVATPILSVVFYSFGFGDPEDRALIARLVLRRG
jgi:O-antigen/teichoic acid export membrane protein